LTRVFFSSLLRPSPSVGLFFFCSALCSHDVTLVLTNSADPFPSLSSLSLFMRLSAGRAVLYHSRLRFQEDKAFFSLAEDPFSLAVFFRCFLSPPSRAAHLFPGVMCYSPLFPLLKLEMIFSGLFDLGGVFFPPLSFHAECVGCRLTPNLRSFFFLDSTYICCPFPV